MSAYYNEFEPYAAAWLRNLISAGHIAPGEVDERSIVEVQPDDLRGFTQGHFFAGIGVWSHALRLAGWPDDRPVWTGSCPCQPFSGAGRKSGGADPRHLWPTWHNLIRELAPTVVFGEQVADAAGLAWLDLVFADMEGAGYAMAAADLCAAGVGAPHIRQRLFFVGDAGGLRREGRRNDIDGAGSPGAWRQADHYGHAGAACGLADAGRCGDERGGGRRQTHGAPGALESEAWERQRGRADARDSGPTGGFWSGAEWVPCRDGKARPAEPGTFPLAHGIANRVGRLRAYGNAIVAPVAAEFIGAAMECLP